MRASTIADRVSRLSTFCGRWSVTRRYSPRVRPSRDRMSRDLPPVAPAPHAQVVIRPGDVQDFEKHVGHVLVVMLARVDDDLLMVLTDLAAHRRGHYELGSCADDARDFHAASDGFRDL